MTRGAKALMAMLLAAGLTAQPASAQFSDGYNFMKAVKNHDALKAKNLIDKPGSTIINTRDGDTGETALTLSINRREAPWVAFLLKHGANPDRTNRAGETPLILAASNGYVDGIRLLLASKANVNAQNGRGETPLIRAVQARNAQVVEILLDARADPDQSDNLTGMSARDYAAADPRAGQVGELLANAPKVREKAVIGPQF